MAGSIVGKWHSGTVGSSKQVSLAVTAAGGSFESVQSSDGQCNCGLRTNVSMPAEVDKDGVIIWQ